MGLDATLREYVGAPVTFSFGLGRVRAFSVVDGTGRAGEIKAISTVPSLWRILLAPPGGIATAAAKVRWIEIGSPFRSGKEKAAMQVLYPMC